MNKIIVLITFCFFNSLIFAATDYRFYATMDDFKNDKPIAGIEIVPNSWLTVFGTESLQLITPKGVDRVKIAKFPSQLFTYEGELLRGYNSSRYYVLEEGALCYYLAYDMFKVHYNGLFTEKVNLYSRTTVDVNGKIVKPKLIDFYSETINGDIKKLTNKILNNYLASNNLLSAYEKDKPVSEKGETLDYKIQKQVNRIIKYFILMNK